MAKNERKQRRGWTVEETARDFARRANELGRSGESGKELADEQNGWMNRLGDEDLETAMREFYGGLNKETLAKLEEFDKLDRAPKGHGEKEKAVLASFEANGRKYVVLEDRDLGWEVVPAQEDEEILDGQR